MKSQIQACGELHSEENFLPRELEPGTSFGLVRASVLLVGVKKTQCNYLKTFACCKMQQWNTTGELV